MILRSRIVIITFIIIVSTFVNLHHDHLHPRVDDDDADYDHLDAKLLFSLPALLLTVAPHLVSKPPQRHICPLQRMVMMMSWQKMAFQSRWHLKLLIGVLQSTPKLFKLRSQARWVAASFQFTFQQFHWQRHAPYTSMWLICWFPTSSPQC